MAANRPNIEIEQVVSNPNHWEDVKGIFELNLSTAAIERIVENKSDTSPLSEPEKNAGELSLDEKLRCFIDRIEFIGHLKILSDHAKNENYIIEGHEVVGVDRDISALRLYLSLTCIDIFRKSNQNNKEYFDFVFENTSNGLKSELSNKLKITCCDTPSDKIGDIALFFYNIRNSYTHGGIRFHCDGTTDYTLTQSFVVGTLKNKTKHSMQITKGFDLIDLINRVAIENARALFGFA